MRRGPSRGQRREPRCGGGHSPDVGEGLRNLLRKKRAGTMGRVLLASPIAQGEGATGRWIVQLLCSWGLTAIGPLQELGGRDRAALPLVVVHHSALHAAGHHDYLAGDMTRNLVGCEGDDLPCDVLRLSDLAERHRA
jgi:hypothetical protein